MVELAGFLGNNAGAGVCGAAVAIFPDSVNATPCTSTCCATTTTTTGAGCLAAGYWAVSGLAANVYDVRITCGSSVRWSRYFSEIQATTLQTGDDGNIFLGNANDVALRWSTADASNHALVLALSDSSHQLHITDVGAIATDWARSASTDPEVIIHSNTSAATDYLSLSHNGTRAIINAVGTSAACGIGFSRCGNTRFTILDDGWLVREPNACGSSTIKFILPNLTGSYELTWPVDDGTCGQQLTTNGSGVLSWAAASLREYKDIHAVVDGAEAYQTILATPIYDYTYKPEIAGLGQWGCFTHHMTGPVADEAVWAMQGRDKSTFSSINAFGMLTAAVQDIGRRLEVLENERD